MELLQIRDLSKSFRDPEGKSLRVVEVPVFDMQAGQQLAMYGESGSGKTTFLNLIAGILKADSGSIRIADREVTQLSESNRDQLRAGSIGYIFQTFNLLQGYSALENVLLAMQFHGVVDHEHAEDLLKRVDLTARMGYRPKQLSVGQQQRVAVARALANKPALVLADEPTGNLDPRHAQGTLELIRELCREFNASLLLVSHDKAILQQFDQVVDLAQINQAEDSHVE